ncbi:unnamed protein product [Caenorhabditis bovis]|uniref:Uncharacterized protein n=1 Tax=Caenorhabditis bovis TaxID=2654633 RepID=A0A8S1EGD4_9PELO|nr:unnamed protein product [Caenorhabditis bovis]
MLAVSLLKITSITDFDVEPDISAKTGQNRSTTPAADSSISLANSCSSDDAQVSSKAAKQKHDINLRTTGFFRIPSERGSINRYTRCLGVSDTEQFCLQNLVQSRDIQFALSRHRVSRQVTLCSADDHVVFRPRSPTPPRPSHMNLVRLRKLRRAAKAQGNVVKEAIGEMAGRGATGQKSKISLNSPFQDKM